MWIHPKGKASLLRDGKLVPEARKILDGKAGILAPDVFWTGEAKGIVVHLRADTKKLQAHKLTAAKVEQAIKKANVRAIPLGELAFLLPKENAAAVRQSLGEVVVTAVEGQPVQVRDLHELTPRDTLPVNEGYAGFTFGYNRPLLANRIHDILTAVACARAHEKTKKVDLVGFDSAGPWVLLARPLCGDAVARTGNMPMPAPREGVVGGHAVLAVGYNDRENRFRMRNSWGSQWGMKGYFTMPYAYLLDQNLSDDFWQVTLIKG